MQPPHPSPPFPRESPAEWSKGPSGPRAGFWRRFAALGIDAALVGVIDLVVSSQAGSVGGLAELTIAVAYFAYLEGGASGQTFGKRALGIRVVDMTSGGPIGFQRALIRYLARILSALPCCLGYLWMLWDRERRTWHDSFAGDVVVPVSRYPVARWPN